MSVIDKESAAAEFDNMCAFFDIDTDTSDLDGDSLEMYDSLRNKVIKAICRGDLCIGSDGAPTYTTKAGTAMKFKQPTGAILLADTKGIQDNQRKMFAMVCELTGGVSTPAKWTIRDTGVLTAIVNLFLAELQ